MKKSDYLGWQEVFCFSLKQGMKEKAYYGFLIIASVVLILSQPVIAFINNVKSEDVYHCEVTDFTIYDEVGLHIDYASALSEEGFEDVNIITTPTKTYEEHVKLLEEQSKDKESEKSTEIIVKLVFEEAGYFNMTFVKASNAALSNEDCQKLADTFVAFFDEARIGAIEVSEEQLDFYNQPVSTKLEFITETGEIIPEKEKNEAISMEEYMLLLFLIMGVMMIVTLCGSSVAMSVVTEKSTKVVEYLMINVRPMALLTGKILSSLLMVVIQFVVLGISYGISSLLKLVLFGNEYNKVLVDTGIEEGTVEISAIIKLISEISPGEVLVALVVILCGILFYCILAGLAGASVSKMDEITEGMKIYNLLIIVGSYIGLGMCIVMVNGGDNQLFIYLCSLFPISSPFVVPASVLLGKISMSIALISMAILIVVTGFMFSFTAKVYESLIFYNGKVLSIKDILQIAKNRKNVKVKEETHHE